MPLIRKDTLLSHELDGELVLYDQGPNVVHTLNATARFVWERCDGSHGAEDIVRELTACYDIPPDLARKDIDRVLARLGSLGLIRQRGLA